MLLTFMLQIALIYSLVRFLWNYALGIYLALIMISVLLAFGMANDARGNQQFWIVVLLIMPGFGFILYFLWGSPRTNSRWKNNMRNIEDSIFEHMPKNAEEQKEFRKIHPNKAQISWYLAKKGFPVYKNTKVEYFPLGDDMADRIIEDLQKAEKFIFMEYFIVYNGVWWKRIQDVLVQKAAEGVDVRLLIDDFGCLFMNVRSLKKELIDKGIRLYSFAPIHKRVYSLAFNFRNHQKITVIDGNVGYTGGINLADEYINEIERFGHWKDTAVRLTGEAVWSLTTTFLVMWEDAGHEKEGDIDRYKPQITVEAPGFVQPYSGGPHRNPDNPVEGAYQRIISKARDYIYISTPYLVLDIKLQSLLIQAAQSGVDVRIVVPHIYDKWYVYMVNVAYYGILMENGVRVYEYTPGFNHAKHMVSDDEVAICGTVNLDYRSLCLHYENGVFFSDNPAVQDLRNDMDAMFAVSEEITYEKWKKRPLYKKLLGSVLKVFSPLL